MAARSDPIAGLRLTPEQRAELITRVQHHFESEHGAELGNLGAETEIRFFAELLGPFIYNGAIEDARALVAGRAETTDEELFGLTRPLPKR